MIFETKKVPLETLGEYLKEVRIQLGLNLSQGAEKTGVAEKYLAFLEESRYQYLPPDVYVLGFLKKIGEAYSISPDMLLTQYRKERGILDQVTSQEMVPSTGWRAKLKNVVITPKLLTLGGGAGLVLLALAYLIIQVSLINQTPPLRLLEPAAGTVIKGSYVTVAGETAPGTTLTINGQNVFVDTEGKFKTTLGASAGQQELSVIAQNKFGKTSAQKVLVMIEPQTAATAAADSSGSEQPRLALELKFTRSTTVQINRDGVDAGEEVIPAGATKSVAAESQIIVSTSDAGSTSAVLNGKELGTLGRAKEQLTVPFTTDSSGLVAGPENNRD